MTRLPLAAVCAAPGGGSCFAAAAVPAALEAAEQAADVATRMHGLLLLEVALQRLAAGLQVRCRCPAHRPGGRCFMVV